MTNHDVAGDGTTPLGDRTPSLAPISVFRDVVVGDSRLVFLSGQVAVDHTGATVGRGDVQVQLEQVYRNIENTIGAAGGRMTDVVQLHTFLTPDADLSLFRAARAILQPRYWGQGPYPTNTLLVVNALADDSYLVEIEATAVVTVRTT